MLVPPVVLPNRTNSSVEFEASFRGQ